MANRYMKGGSTSQIIRGVQIKTTVKHHLTPVRMPIITDQRQQLSEDMEEGNRCALWVGMQMGTATVGNSTESSKN